MKRTDYDEVRGEVPSFLREPGYIAPIENEYVETQYYLTDEASHLLGFLRGEIDKKTTVRLEELLRGHSVRMQHDIVDTLRKFILRDMRIWNGLPRVDNEISEIIKEIKPYIRRNNV